MNLRNWSFVRWYLFEYVTGVLWIGVFSIFTGGKAVVSVAKFIRGVALAIGGDKPPDFILGLLAVTAAIVLPYCVALVLDAASFLVFTIVHPLALRIIIKKLVENDGLADLAGRSITVRLGPSLTINDDLRYWHVIAAQSDLSNQIARSREEILLRAVSLLPAALLFAGTTWRLVATRPWDIVCGVLVGTAVFAITYVDVNKAMLRLQRRIDMTILLIEGERAVMK